MTSKMQIHQGVDVIAISNCDENPVKNMPWVDRTGASRPKRPPIAHDDQRRVGSEGRRAFELILSKWYRVTIKIRRSYLFGPHFCFGGTVRVDGRCERRWKTKRAREEDL